MKVFVVAFSCCLSLCPCKPSLAIAASPDFTQPRFNSQNTHSADHHPKSSMTRLGEIPTVQTSSVTSPRGRMGHPANIQLKDGLLTVAADNSDLTQILAAIAKISGMAIDGSVGDVRVFGTYGPGNSREVLTKLLRGLGYNFIMVGATPEGTPRTLQLTLRSASPPPSSGPAVSAQTPPPEAHAEDQEQPGPGAILHVPPAPSEDTQDRMRQRLQRLQQMHDQQKPQNTPQ